MTETATQEKPKPITARQAKMIRPLMKAFSKFNVWVYRMSNGKMLGTMQGAPVCLVTMTGRKSGKERTLPLIHIRRGDDVILIASQGGMAKNPVWYYNIAANPDIVVQTGGDVRRMRARQASDAEKEEIWPLAVDTYKDFDIYQARTERNIPVFICEPVNNQAGEPSA